MQVKTVFIDGLPASWDEDHVKEHLRKYGKIEKIELARNMPAAKRTDFGFITFDTHDVAVACVEGVNNTELGDGEKKVCCHSNCWLLHALIPWLSIPFHYGWNVLLRTPPINVPARSFTCYSQNWPVLHEQQTINIF